MFSHAPQGWLRFCLASAIRQRRSSSHYGIRFRYQRGAGLTARVKPRAGGETATIGFRRGSSDVEIFKSIFLAGGYNLRALPWWPDIQRYCRQAANPVILDLGANIGLAALAFHWQLPSARILAVEPEPGNFAQLRRHTAGTTAIIPVQGAVASRCGWGRILDPDADTLGFRVAPAEMGCPGTVPAYTVERLLELASLRSAPATPILVKMDVEGAERDLFSTSSRAWLARTPLLIVETHDWLMPGASLSHGLMQALAARRGDVFARGEDIYAWLPSPLASAAAATD